MNIYVYSDESGVLDKAHNRIFVFGGLVFLSKDEKDVAARKYSVAEKTVRKIGRYGAGAEIKASTISADHKRKLYRSLNGFYKFGVIVEQSRVMDSIMADKKSKQRYLDYVFKIGVKRLLQELIKREVIKPDDVQNMFFMLTSIQHLPMGSTNSASPWKKSSRGVCTPEILDTFSPSFPKCSNSLFVLLQFLNCSPCPCC